MSKVPSSVATFLTKTQSANNRKSKEVVLTIQEATDLSLALSSLLNTQNELLKDIVDLQKRLLDGPIEVIVDGGRG
jgi:hypothetical protein